MTGSKETNISVYDNDRSTYERSTINIKSDKYTLVNFPLRTKVSTSGKQSSLYSGSSVMKSKHIKTMGTLPVHLLNNMKHLKQDREKEDNADAPDNNSNSALPFIGKK